MKKVILLAVLSFFSMVASAASLSWSINGRSILNPDGSGSKLSGALAYLVQGTPTNDLVTAIKGGTWNPSSAFASGTSDGGGGATGSVENAAWAAGSTLDVYVIVFDGATIANSNYFMVSSTASGILGNGGDVPGTAATWTAATVGEFTNGWQPLNVPEPTVLALLALGVAGLALRRKTA